MKEYFNLIMFAVILAALSPFAVAFGQQVFRACTRGLAINARRGTATAPRLLSLNERLQHAESTMDKILLPAGDSLRHEQIVAANESLFTESYFSQPLTDFAVGWRDGNDLDRTAEFLAPGVMVPRRFEYAYFTNAEEFYSETTDDARAIRGDFKTVEYTETKVNAATVNRGLMMKIDLDMVADKKNWQEHYTAKLLRRLKRNKIRRAFALLAAASSNTDKVWGASGNPDGDLRSGIIAAHTSSGVRPNRVLFGDTAWDYRCASYEQQDTAGAGAALQRDERRLAAFLGIDDVYISKERYATSASAKAEVAANTVLLFNALSGADEEDPSNIKCFWSPTESGDQYRVYVQQVTAKLFTIVVEHYELIKITSTLGIRKITATQS